MEGGPSFEKNFQSILIDIRNYDMLNAELLSSIFVLLACNLVRD